MMPLCALTSFKLWRTGLYRRYLALCGFLVLNFLSYLLILFWFSDLTSAGYLKFYIYTQPLAWIISILVVRELYTLVLERFKGLATLGRWFQYAGLVIALLISGLLLLPKMRTGTLQRSALLGYYYGIERGVDCALLVFLLLLLVWLSRYPVPLSRNLLIHSLVYSTLFLAGSVGLFARVFFGFELSRSVSTFLTGVLAACVFTWLICLSERGEEVRLSVPRFGPEEEKRILNQLEALNSTLLRISR
ncbi:MAG TPA: hypothetical protein VG096_16235 [Bryobacteraceae bacterium]|nr:hypothetical protein [Bryobacteraceae bacterium]